MIPCRKFRPLTMAPCVPIPDPTPVEIVDATPEELATKRHRDAAKFVRRAGREQDAKLSR